MPIKVTVIKDNTTNQFLFNGPLSTIGRRSECDISIRDPSVSGLHAQIRKVGKNFLIQDMQSTNGVFFKGRKIKQHVIKHNDVVFVGEHQLTFALVPDSTDRDVQEAAIGFT